MIAIGPRSFVATIKRLWPPYRRQQDAALYDAIKHLVEHPDEDCIIAGHFVPGQQSR
jgi:hypothetical protein